MIRPGPRNLITDVDGILVGNAEDQKVRTGTTVVLCAERMVGAVDVRGGAPGTRDIDLLNPTCLVERIDAVVLSGGSAFGLEAGAGAVAWLAERGRGFAVGPARVPIVPGRYPVRPVERRRQGMGRALALSRSCPPCLRRSRRGFHSRHGRRRLWRAGRRAQGWLGECLGGGRSRSSGRCAGGRQCLRQRHDAGHGHVVGMAARAGKRAWGTAAAGDRRGRSGVRLRCRDRRDRPPSAWSRPTPS